MFYVIITNLLAYPKDIEFPTLQTLTNNTEFRYPLFFAKKTVDYRAQSSAFPVYEDILSARSAIESRKVSDASVPTHTTGIICLPKDKLDVSYEICKLETIEGKLLVWTSETSMPIATIHFRRFMTDSTIKGIEAFDVLVYDDYAALWQQCYLESLKCPTKIPVTNESGLIKACSDLNIPAITTEIKEIIAKDVTISSAPLAFLFAKAVDDVSLVFLQIALALLIIQGEHECVYKDEVYNRLCKQIGKVNQAWLPRFFEELVQALIMGCFKVCDYAAFINHAKKNEIDECFRFINKGLRVYRAHKERMYPGLFFQKQSKSGSSGSISDASTVRIDDRWSGDEISPSDSKSVL